MKMWTSHVLLTCLCISSLFTSLSYSSPRIPVGAHPLDEKYYDSELIKCKDGSKSFTKDRLNDDFCDCADGTDEPGTSACPYGKFYCRNVGSIPKFLFSSRVNDRICDCCDGSDEYDGSAICPNICVMGGYTAYHYRSHDSDIDSVGSRKRSPEKKVEDSSPSLRGMLALVILQGSLLVIVVAFRLSRRQKTRRRNLR